MAMETLEDTAEAYEALLVPSLFDTWARRLVDVVDVKSGSVLDVACGTGVLARRMQERLGTTGSVAGIDLNPAMLGVAKRKAPEIKWHEGNAGSLPFDDNTFDAVLCQFGLMLFPSPAVALREMHRVLKRGGHLSVLVFDSLGNNRTYELVADVYERVVGSAVGDALRIPFSMGHTDQLAALFEDAGIRNARISTDKETVRFASPRHMVLSDVKGWFPFAEIQLDEQTLQGVIDEAERVLESFRTSDGAVEFDVAAHTISATKS